MSPASGYIKGACTACSGHIEFPSDALGYKIACPHCGRETALLNNLQPAGTVQLRVNLPAANPPPAPSPAPAPLPRQAPPPPPPAAATPGPRPQVNIPIPAAKTPAPPAEPKRPAASQPAKATAASPKPAPKVSVECPSCGLEVSVKAEACPGCGAVLKEKQKFPWMAIAGGAVAVIAILYFGGGALFKKGKPSWLAGIGDKITSLTKKNDGTTPPAETKPGEPMVTEGKPPPESKPVAEKKAPEKKKVLSGKFELLNYTIERTPGRSLVYVVGSVTNGTPKQAFSVRVTFDLFNKKGDPAGNATDYVQVIEPGDGWQFRALILDTNAITAKLASLDKEKDQ